MPEKQYTLSITKLFRVPSKIRLALKCYRINTCGQLLAAAGRFEQREALAHSLRLSASALTDLVQQADLKRIDGIGRGFGLLQLDVGVVDVAMLAEEEPPSLHDRLYRHNRAERLVRRAPSLDEVADWISQARCLPKIVSYPPKDSADKCRSLHPSRLLS